MPRPLLLALGFAAAVSAAVLVADGGDTAAGRAAKAAPEPVPGYYLTASSAGDLERQAYDAGARVARAQGSEHTLLALDFGAARLKDGDYGTALRGGTFFGNDEIGEALQAAVRGYHDNYRQGDVTVVYANSNALLGRSRRALHDARRGLRARGRGGAGQDRRGARPRGARLGDRGRRHRGRLRQRRVG